MVLMSHDLALQLRHRHAHEKHDLERLTAQLDFVRGLCDLHPNEAVAWKPLIERATEMMATTGLAAAEAVLAPIAAMAKSYTIHCVGHAHIDMNWQWGWQETVAITLDTFRTVLGLMDEFPDFRFSQSQASVYRIVQDHDPELFARIVQLVREGRWEVTASHWVEGERNIAGAEAICRQLSETRRFLFETMGLTPEDVPIDWSPDTFGHAATIPTIDTRAGVKFLYCCRTGTTTRPPVFWWQAPDGSRLLVNREIAWYNGEATPSMTGKLVEFSKLTGLRTWMQVYGVGDHGGGPTRRDLRRFQDMGTWPIFPTFRFGKALDFFKLLEAEGARWPVLNHELNYEFTGCYTSQSMIKRGNRQGERLMIRAEAALALAGGRSADLSASWRNVLFGHFHDILPGSGLPATRIWQLALMQQVEADAGEQTRSGLRRLAARIRTDLVPASGSSKLPTEFTSRAYGAGVGRGNPHHAGDGPRAFVVFNAVGAPRHDVVQLTVWDGDAGPELPPVHQRRWRAVLADGTRLPVQAAGNGHYWGHDYADLLLPVRVGSLGWNTVVVEEGDAPEAPPAGRARIDFELDGGHGQLQSQPHSHLRMHNDLVAVSIDRRSGAIVSLKVGEAEFAAGAFAAVEYQHERPTGMSAWLLGDPAGAPQALIVEEVKAIEHGPWRVAVEVRMKLNDSRVTVTYALTTGSPVVQVGVKTRWVERGSAEIGIPRLQIALPCALVGTSGRFEVPFGAVTRPADGRTVPALRWAAVVGQLGGQLDGQTSGQLGGVQLMNDGAHGHELTGSTLRLQLVRSSYDPDPLPEIGDHAWRLGILPWIGERSEAELVRAAAAFDQPLDPVGCGVHGGDLPSTADGVGSTHPDVVVTALKPADDGNGLIVHLANHSAVAVPATVTIGAAVPLSALKMTACDGLDRPLATTIIAPHGIAALRLAK